MRILAITVAGLVTLLPTGARADQRETLQQKGEQQAKEGRYADAIDSFKAADRIQQRASHACLIALAYTRRELWSQAQLWLTTCHDRASAGDPMPDWTPLAEKQIKDRLATTNVAAVTIVVKPADANAKVTVSSFAPDEVFEPRTIHLAPGTHVIFARADGYPERQQTIELRDKSPQTVVIDLTEQPITTPGPTPRGEGARPDTGLGTGLLVGGAGLLIAGGGFHLLMSFARQDMVDATDGYIRDGDDFTEAMGDYEEAEKRFDRWRALAIGSYVVGAGLAVTGYILRKNATRESARVGLVPLPEGGAFVSVGWSR